LHPAEKWLHFSVPVTTSQPLVTTLTASVCRGGLLSPVTVRGPIWDQKRSRRGKMAIVDSTTGKVIRDYNVEELKEQAKLMRGYDLAMLCAAGSGHAGGTLSIMDIAAALYLKVLNHDPKNPDWAERDRVIWSTGH